MSKNTDLARECGATTRQLMGERHKRIEFTTAQLDAFAERVRAEALLDRHILQADGKHPAPCAKFCEATAFRGEISRLTTSDKENWLALKEAAAEIATLTDERTALVAQQKACDFVQVGGESQTLAPEVELVWCGCGDGYPADSFEAGIMSATGQCSNCSAALKVGAPEYAPKFDEAAFAKLTENGAKAWADVPDATAWVDELRGNTPERQAQ